MQPGAGYGAAAPPYGSAASGTYEFNDGENLTIGEVARYARLWGIISLVSGILLLVVGIIVATMGAAIAAAASSGGSGALSPAIVGAVGVALVPSAIVSIVGGIFYTRSGAALRSVVDTQGNDVALLTEAVRSLLVAFKIEAIAMAVGFAVGLVIGVAGHTSGGH